MLLLLFSFSASVSRFREFLFSTLNARLPIPDDMEAGPSHRSKVLRVVSMSSVTTAAAVSDDHGEINKRIAAVPGWRLVS